MNEIAFNHAFDEFKAALHRSIEQFRQERQWGLSWVQHINAHIEEVEKHCQLLPAIEDAEPQLSRHTPILHIRLHPDTIKGLPNKLLNKLKSFGLTGHASGNKIILPIPTESAAQAKQHKSVQQTTIPYMRGPSYHHGDLFNPRPNKRPRALSGLFSTEAKTSPVTPTMPEVVYFNCEQLCQAYPHLATYHTEPNPNAPINWSSPQLLTVREGSFHKPRFIYAPPALIETLQGNSDYKPLQTALNSRELVNAQGNGIVLTPSNAYYHGKLRVGRTDARIPIAEKYIVKQPDGLEVDLYILSTDIVTHKQLDQQTKPKAPEIRVAAEATDLAELLRFEM